jgi:phosphoadenosine phosphosulfate reductase
MDRAKIQKAKDVLIQAKTWYVDLAVAWTTGKDSSVLLGLLQEIYGKVQIPVIHVDTTFHFQEVYELREQVAKDLELDLHIALADVPTGYKQAEEREDCCHKLKTVPLNKMIKQLKVRGLICGIRRDECKARSDEKYFSGREDHFRVHPILDWTEIDVWEYIEKNELPVNPLYKQGYRSIGCFPCTEPSPDSEDERAGRSQDKEKVMERLRSLGYF